MSKQPGEERQSRKPKSENRFYNFLSRSRSRSRPKDARLLPDSDPASSQGVRRAIVSPDSKPPARIASRPISSTTAATNATVVPSTPKPRPRPVPALPIPAEPISSDLRIPTRPSTPKPSGSRKKLHNLFGISLHSPKKSSFGLTTSHPSSSRSSLDVPPMPAQPASLNSRPKNKLTSRSDSPGKVAKVRHNATASLTDISNVQCPVPSANMFHRIFSGSKATPVEPVPLISVSAPIRRPSQHRSAGRHPSGDKPLPDPEPSASVPLMPPHIIYTPATPDRAIPPSPSKNHEPKKSSVDSGKRSRSSDTKGREREKKQHASRHDTITRSGKHGSFDFENPTPNAGMIPVQRSESGTDVFSSLSAWNRHIEHTGQERDSSFGPGLAGVGTLQREMSLRRGKEWEEQLRAREVERKKQMKQQRKKKHEQASSQDAQLVQKDDTGGSTSTAGTGHAAAKRSAMSTKTGSGSGLPKVSTMTHHPAFDFEPPVPSSTSWSASSMGMLHDVSSSSSEKRSNEKRHQKPKPRLSEERYLSPGPTSTAIGHRSALKGRSLDLGLGLAWAPSSVREEALLPSLNIGRSFSQSSSVKSATDTQTAGRPSNDHVKAGSAEGASKLDKEIAAVFKSTLDRDGFASFKRYVHQFDAYEIPFDGPTGIIARVDQLLGESSTLKQHEKRELMDQLVRIILRNA